MERSPRRPIRFGSWIPEGGIVWLKRLRLCEAHLDADNPGQWLYHCHNAYHAAQGMMGVLSYVR
ncbi:multicopper oxidase domain-containing protein [Sinomonas sp. JGH33]|uniref:Multicopper oxidase domain-containing protein n=1 Tax=Sinomonas terricola TaxID=3110330 RepID=A0ABU5T615_9MICC|nr:multicopper oxidase domain-containing protein [Sinomonas sp. JGH33]MEA5455117.1 multicopper oxidase domain-containing protein [Sinomonas sp. JGH33]